MSERYEHDVEKADETWRCQSCGQNFILPIYAGDEECPVRLRAALDATAAELQKLASQWQALADDHAQLTAQLSAARRELAVAVPRAEEAERALRVYRSGAAAKAADEIVAVATDALKAAARREAETDLRNAVNAVCSCGGREPGDDQCCLACWTWHKWKARRSREGAKP